MRRLLIVALVLAAGCGGGSDAAGGSNPTGGSTFTGTFVVEPGAGPGEIIFTLDTAGERIVSATIDPALTLFACPTGATISGGGFTVTYAPGIAIEGNSFADSSWSGVFDSATEAHGSYDLQDDYDCPHVLTWTATSQ